MCLDEPFPCWGCWPGNAAADNFTKPLFKSMTGVQLASGGSCLQKVESQTDVFRNSWSPNSVFALNASQRASLISTMCGQSQLMFDGYSKSDISIGAMAGEH